MLYYFLKFVFSDLGADQSIYYVFAENAQLSEGASSFIVGLKDLFCALFVHNFMYPKISSKTLDFIQQHLLKIIPKFGQTIYLLLAL